MTEQILEQPSFGGSSVPPSGEEPKTAGAIGVERFWSPHADSLGTAAVIAGAWAALIIASALYNPEFLSRQTLLSITFTMSVAGVVTISQSLVTMSGGLLDLSIPTGLILPAWVMVTLLAHGVNLVLTILVTLLTGGAWGLLNATIIAFAKINPIIVTLATNFAGAAFVNIYLTSAETPINSGFAHWGQGHFLSVPNVFWPMLIFVAAAGYFVSHSRVGRRLIAVGGNPQAARARGISLRKTRFGVFIVAGVITGFAAILFTGSTLTFVSSDTTSYLLPSVAATILAGISLRGGSGHLWLTFLSVGLLATVPTTLAFFGVSELWQLVPPGAILVVAISIDGVRQRRSAR